MTLENKTFRTSPLFGHIASDSVLSEQLADLVFLEEILQGGYFDKYIPYFVRFSEDGMMIDEKETFRFFHTCWSSNAHIFGEDIILKRWDEWNFTHWKKNSAYSLDWWLTEIFQYLLMVGSKAQSIDVALAKDKLKEIHVRKKRDFLKNIEKVWREKSDTPGRVSNVIDKNI